MEKEINQIVKIANILDSQKQFDIASKLDKLSENFVNIKSAQYLGVQGAAIRNSRCIQNCYRQKRATQKNKPTQIIWQECQNEWMENLSGKNPSFDKYASNDVVSKFTKQAELEDYFNANVEELFTLAKDIKDEELQMKVASICDSLVKEAQFGTWQNSNPVGRTLGKAWDWASGQDANVRARIKRILQQIQVTNSKTGTQFVEDANELVSDLNKEMTELSNFSSGKNDASSGKIKDLLTYLMQSVTKFNAAIKSNNEQQAKSLLGTMYNNVVNINSNLGLKPSAPKQKPEDPQTAQWEKAISTVIADLNMYKPDLAKRVQQTWDRYKPRPDYNAKQVHDYFVNLPEIKKVLDSLNIKQPQQGMSAKQILNDPIWAKPGVNGPAIFKYIQKVNPALYNKLITQFPTGLNRTTLKGVLNLIP